MMAALAGHGDVDEHGYGEGQGQLSAESKARGPRQQRACETCRHLKVRCIFNESNPNGPCIKCTKLRQPCNIRPYYRKKRAKKADTRVADLERKMEALVASLKAQRKGPSSIPELGNSSHPTTTTKETPSSSHETAVPSLSAAHSEHTADSLSADDPGTPPTEYELEQAKKKRFVHYSQPDFSDYVDVIDRGFLTSESAYEMFDQYIDRSHCLPLVVFPPGTTAMDIRSQKPLLFLSILAVSNSVSAEMSKMLGRELNKLIAMQCIVEGKASLELLQAILIDIGFIPPPSMKEGKNYTYLVGLATAMAEDLELGKRTESAYAFQDAKRHINDFCDLPPPQASETELRRTWLAVYYLSSSISTLTRRPSGLRWNLHTDECMKVLETSPEALTSDRFLCQILRCQRIIEDAQFQLGLDGIQDLVSFADAKTSYQLRGFDTQISEWHSDTLLFPQKDVANLLRAVTGIYVHDISLNQNINGTSWKCPMARAIEESGEPQPISSTHSWSILSCLQYAHQAFEAIFALPVERLKALPTIFQVRMFYAAIVLVRFETLLEQTKDLPLTLDDIKVTYYLSRFQLLLKEACASEGGRTLSLTYMIISSINQWHNAVSKKRTGGVKADVPLQPNADKLCQPAPGSNFNEVSLGPGGTLDPLSTHVSNTQYNNDNLAAPLLPETPQPSFDLDMMDFAIDPSNPAGFDWMMEGMGMGWMTSGFNFNAAP